MAVDARAPSPQMITHGSYPKRACPTTVDARVYSRMISRSALLGVEADACANPQMISHAPALDAVARPAEGALATLILTLIIPVPESAHAVSPKDGERRSCSRSWNIRLWSVRRAESPLRRGGSKYERGGAVVSSSPTKESA